MACFKRQLLYEKRMTYSEHFHHKYYAVTQEFYNNHSSVSSSNQLTEKELVGKSSSAIKQVQISTLACT